jgi:putative membrane protein
VNAAGVPSLEPRRRLHPLSPLLRSAKLIAITVAAISWQGFAQLGPLRWLEVVVVVLLGAVALSAVTWWFTGYHVVGRELRVYEGLLWRRTRAIPLERVQAVDLVRPVLARAAGLAELRLEVIGASKAEAPLAYLSVDDAIRLRDRLLQLSSRPLARAAPGTRPGTEPEPASDPQLAAEPQLAADRLVHTVDNRDVLIGQLLTPQVWFVPVGVLIVLVQFAFSPVWTFIGVASLLTAMIGVLQQPARRILDDWHFRIAIGPAGLRLRHGLLETRSQTIPPHRVQAVGLTWPLLWRGQQWLRSQVDVAGYGGPDSREAIRAGRLLPVGTLETARQVVFEVLPEVDVARLPIVPPPRRARWLAPLRQPVLGAGLTDRVFVTRDGLLTRELVIVPYARIQSVRVVQGPLQRRLGLATVHADTAGGLHGAAHHRDLAEAWQLAAALDARAREARVAAADRR